MKLMPNEKVPYDLFVPDIAEAYYNCGETEKADTIVSTHLDMAAEDLSYFMSLKPAMMQTIDYEMRIALQVSQDYRTITRNAGREELAKRAEDLFTLNYQHFIQQQQGGSTPQPR